MIESKHSKSYKKWMLIIHHQNDAGFTYLANEDLQFDFSFGTGIKERMNYISVSFSWLIDQLEDDQ